MKKLVLLMSLLASFSIFGAEQLKCKQVAQSVFSIIERCENSEVVCYVSSKGGLFCKFKEK